MNFIVGVTIHLMQLSKTVVGAMLVLLLCLHPLGDVLVTLGALTLAIPVASLVMTTLGCTCGVNYISGDPNV
jgi:hypothetical protein